MNNVHYNNLYTYPMKRLILIWCSHYNQFIYLNLRTQLHNIYIQCIFPFMFVLKIRNVQFPMNTLGEFMRQKHKYKGHHAY